MGPGRAVSVVRRDAPHLAPKVRSTALTKGVRAFPCTLKLAGFVGQSCEGQVVGCHLDEAGGKGTATKVTDLAVVAGCQRCHDLLDRRNPVGIKIRRDYPAAYGQQLLRALVHTQALLAGEGIIQVKDGKVIWS